MTQRPTGPACGNNPNYRMSDGDRQAVEAFKAYLAERAALRDRIAEALYAHDHPGHLVPLNQTGMQPAYRESADAVLAELPPPTDRAEAQPAPYEQIADRLDLECARRVKAAWSPEEATAAREWGNVAAFVRGLATEEQPAPAVDLKTLAAALDGLHTLIATSSRDWGQYRVDAWLWAVLCGWDCEQVEHDDTCTHGALEEMAAMHGWDEETVVKARRYRAAVCAVVESQQDGAQL